MIPMNKYKVMLCDDEQDAIEAIIAKLKWEELGYAIPVTASNGIEALEKCEEYKPDVVMTDINMPYMNGLELARQLKQQYPNIKIIIFSGYDDFEYAKEAVHLSCEEYILKPIDREELRKVFERVHTTLDTEYDERTNIDKLQSYYRESLPALQENFLTSLIEKSIPAKQIPTYMQNYALHLDGPKYAVVVIHTSTTHVPEGMTSLLCNLSVRRMAEEECHHLYQEVFFTYLGNTCMIVNIPDEKIITSLTDAMDRFCRLAYTSLKAIVTIGIGQVVDSVENLSQSYEGARNAVSYRVLYGTGKAINICEVAPEKMEDSEEMEDTDLHEVFKKIRVNDAQGLEQAIHTFITESEPHMTNIQDYRFFVMDIMTALYRFARNNHLSTSDLFAKKGDVYQYASKIEKKDLEASLYRECLEVQKRLNESRTNSTRSFVVKAQEYANENYPDETLSVDTICRELGVSAAYFSTVFKKETGKAFIQYLTDIRMNKAAQLLCEKDRKTYVIAKEVGYSDPNYFSYVFKKKFGVSPSKYRSGEGE